jgi:arylsulfatase A-like enzyme
MSGTAERTGLVRRLVLLALPALLTGAFVVGPDDPSRAANAEDPVVTNGPGSRPSVVLIMTDDQRPETMDKMPELQKRITDLGVNFTESFSVNPECCPSRASTLTGLYSHNTGVYRDQPPHGGVKTFHGQGNEKRTIAKWLHKDGYTTSLMGKYLNGYKGTRVPRGWDNWMSFNVPHSGTGHYTDYDLNINGKLKHYGDRPKDYSTDVLARKASAFINNTNGPLFLYWSPSAPHKPAIPARRHKGTLKGMRNWRPKSFNERRIGDKPKWAQFPRMSKEDIRQVDEDRLKQYRTLLSVDDAVGKIMDALRKSGRLHNTLIIYTSDNGFLWGEHRLEGKQAPWEESIRVPFIFRYDPVTGSTGTKNPNLIANIDIAPTIIDLADLRNRNLDGLNIFDLLEGGDWRTEFLIEHMKGKYSPAPTYCALRTQTSMYAVYKTGDRELYDLTNDPLELKNLAYDPSYDDQIYGGDGYNDRLREACDPPPPDWNGP